MHFQASKQAKKLGSNTVVVEENNNNDYFIDCCCKLASKQAFNICYQVSAEELENAKIITGAHKHFSTATGKMWLAPSINSIPAKLLLP